jgi:hypothetical protein
MGYVMERQSEHRDLRNERRRVGVSRGGKGVKVKAEGRKKLFSSTWSTGAVEMLLKYNIAAVIVESEDGGGARAFSSLGINQVDMSSSGGAAIFGSRASPTLTPPPPLAPPPRTGRRITAAPSPAADRAPWSTGVRRPSALQEVAAPDGDLGRLASGFHSFHDSKPTTRPVQLDQLGLNLCPSIKTNRC